MKFDKNVLILGLGQVAIGYLSLIEENKPDLGKVKFYAMDIVEPHSTVKNLLDKLGAEFIQGDYRFDLEDVLAPDSGKNIGYVLNLIPNSSYPIWNAIEKLPYPCMYQDASVYLCSYSSMLNDRENILLSNFVRFDEIKHKYKNVIGICDTGMNAGIVSAWYRYMLDKYGQDALAAYVIEYDCVRKKNGAKISDTTWAGSAYFEECGIEATSYFRDGLPYTLADKTPAIDNPIKFKMRGNEYKGYAVIHSECRSLAKRNNCETAFLYAFDEMKEKGCREYKKSFDDNEVEVISPLKYELEGEETCGVKIVYKDKEVNLINIMKNGSNKYVNPVILQVSIGVYAGFMMGLKAHELGVVPLSGSLNWIEDWFDTDYRLYDEFLKVVFSLMKTKEEILDFSEGLIKDRLVNPKEELALIPHFFPYSKKPMKFSFEDIWWKHVEQNFNLSYDENDENEDSVWFGFLDYCYIAASNKFKEKTWESYNEAYKEIVNFVEKRIKMLEENEDVYLLFSEHCINCESILISDLEATLIEEGFLQHNISNFLQNNIQTILSVDENTLSEYKDLYEYVVSLFELQTHWENIR